LRDQLGGRSLLEMSNHTLIVVERIDWRITKAACSCGEELKLGKDVGSPKQQFERLEAAFLDHKKARGIASTKDARLRTAPKKKVR
jgi:hypothetical protein